MDEIERINQYARQNFIPSNAPDWHMAFGQMAPPPVQPQKKKKGFLVDNISTVGGIIGGLGGGALGGLFGAGVGALPGAAAGGALGSGLGETLENILTGEDLSKNVAKEAILGGIFSAGPVKLAKFGLGAGAALTGGEAAAGGLVKGFAQGAGKAAAGETAEQAGEQILKTGLRGRLTSMGNESLKSQYGTIGKAVARETDAPKTIGKLAEIGFTKPTDVERMAQTLTGPDGMLNVAVTNAVAGAGKVNIGSVPAALEKSLAESGLTKSHANAIRDVVESKLKTIDPSDPSSVLRTMRDLEAKAADFLGKSGTHHLATSEDKIRATVLREVRDHLQDQLYNVSGANKNLANVLTPELRNRLVGLAPKNNTWVNYVDNTIMKAKDIGTLRHVQEPFVKISKVIDEADLNGMTYGGRVGNVFNQALQMGGLPGVAASVAGNVALKPAQRIAGETLRDIGTGQALNQSAKGFGGIAGNLGMINLAANSLMPDSDGNVPPNDGQTQQPGGLEDALINQQMPQMNGAGMGMTQPFGGNSFGMMEQPQSASPYSKQALIYDLQRDPANADKYIAIYKEISDIFEPAAGNAKPLTEGQQMRADLINSLGLTENAVNQGSINYGPIGSRIEGIKSMFNNADPETLAFKNTVSGLRAAIAKARAGASMSDGERALLNQYTPNDTDSEQVVISKLRALRQLYGYDMPQGGAPTMLQDALMQQGGF